MTRASFVGAIALSALTWAPQAALCQTQESGLRAYVDPQTGRLSAPPPGSFTSEGSAAAAPEEPFVVEPGRTEAGGVMVDLGNRLTYTLQATLGPDGKVTTECIEEQRGQ